MTSVFVESLARNFDDALRLLEAALSDCPDELWETDLWPDEAPTAPAPHGGLHGSAPLTDDAAAQPVPRAHRYGGMTYGVLIASLPLHTIEHAAQVRQFLTAAGVRVRPMPGDRGYAG
jgi:hypothetical protein